MQTTKQLQRFYVVEVFRPQPPIPGSQGSETVSLPCGASAFDRAQYTTRDNRMLIEAKEKSWSLHFTAMPVARSSPLWGGFTQWNFKRGSRWGEALCAMRNSPAG